MYNSTKADDKEHMSSALVVFSHASPFHNPHHQPRRYFEYGARQLMIQQEWRDDGKGGTDIGFGAVVYSAAIVLAEYLNSNPHVVHEKNVLELGCGTGLVSIVSSLLGAKMTHATDGDESVVTLARKNMECNAIHQSKCRAERLLWGTPCSFRPDIILAADIVACPYRDAFNALLQTMIDFSSQNKDLVILFTCKKRNVIEETFFIRAKKHFVIECLVHDVPKEFQQHGISLLRLTRRDHQVHVI